MNLDRKPLGWRSAALIGVGACAVGALAVTSAVSASAAPTPKVDSRSSVVVTKLQALQTKLGAGASAGSWVDSKGTTHVAVTSDAAAAAIKALGGVPKRVERSMTALASATNSLASSARVPGTAWAVDPATNQVLVSVDSTVTGSELSTVKAAVKALGPAARLEKVSGTFSTRISGGDAIYGGGYRCSLGFNVWNGTSIFFLTAGHCGNLATTWYSNSARTAVLGTKVGSSFPTNDYSLIRYTANVVHYGVVDTYNGATQDITAAGTPTVGQTVYRSGSTTHVHSGQVTALNATVTYPEGTVSGLIRTTVCAEGGDSGGALYAGTTALGLTSGGSGNCTTGGTTYFQPVTEALQAYGVYVY